MAKSWPAQNTMRLAESLGSKEILFAEPPGNDLAALANGQNTEAVLSLKMSLWSIEWNNQYLVTDRCCKRKAVGSRFACKLLL